MKYVFVAFEIIIGLALGLLAVSGLRWWSLVIFPAMICLMVWSDKKARRKMVFCFIGSIVCSVTAFGAWADHQWFLYAALVYCAGSYLKSLNRLRHTWVFVKARTPEGKDCTIEIECENPSDVPEAKTKLTAMGFAL